MQSPILQCCCRSVEREQACQVGDTYRHGELGAGRSFFERNLEFACQEAAERHVSDFDSIVGSGMIRGNDGVANLHPWISDDRRIADDALGSKRRSNRFLPFPIVHFDTFCEKDVVATFAEDAIQMPVADQDVCTFVSSQDVPIRERMELAESRRLDFDRKSEIVGLFGSVRIEDTKIVRPGGQIAQIGRGDVLLEDASGLVEEVGADSMSPSHSEPRTLFGRWPGDPQSQRIGVADGASLESQSDIPLADGQTLADELAHVQFDPLSPLSRDHRFRQEIRCPSDKVAPRDHAVSGFDECLDDELSQNLTIFQEANGLAGRERVQLGKPDLVVAREVGVDSTDKQGALTEPCQLSQRCARDGAGKEGTRSSHRHVGRVKLRTRHNLTVDDLEQQLIIDRCELVDTVSSSGE